MSTPSDISKLIRLCKRHGVSHATWGDISLTFGGTPLKRASSAKKSENYKPTEEEIELRKQLELDTLMHEDPMEWEKAMKGMR